MQHKYSMHGDIFFVCMHTFFWGEGFCEVQGGGEKLEIRNLEFGRWGFEFGFWRRFGLRVMVVICAKSCFEKWQVWTSRGNSVCGACCLDAC
jgi:hypothetical protein